MEKERIIKCTDCQKEFKGHHLRRFCDECRLKHYKINIEKMKKTTQEMRNKIGNTMYKDKNCVICGDLMGGVYHISKRLLEKDVTPECLQVFKKKRKSRVLQLNHRRYKNE